jgi:two-component system, chemotaxis family, chemotaxis protein CheY
MRDFLGAKKNDSGGMMGRGILIAEDSAVTRAFLVSTLEEIGDFDIVEASTGFEALKQLPRREFALIITDINMPDINGLELINFVKNNVNYRNIPLIVVTTEGADRDRQKGIALGADEYLVKPIDPVLLQKVVEKHLNNSREIG